MTTSRPGRTMRVLVTDANAAAAVASVRSLGRRGVACITAWQGTAFPLAATSRYCSGVLRLPDLVTEPDAYAEQLLGHVRRGEIDAVMPISDGALSACAPVRREIERLAAYCAAPEAALAAAEDKWGILERARAAGLAVPPACLVEDDDGWRAAQERLTPPLVLRSRWSLIRAGGRFQKPPSGVAFDLAAAGRDIAGRLAHGESTVVTSYRAGTGRGIYLFMDDGVPAAWFGHLRLRETNPRGSAACAAIPLMPTDDDLARCASLASDLGLTGAAMLEFRRHGGSEPDWLVEINPRLWGSIQLAVHAGFDFPWWQFRYFTEGEVPAMREPHGDVTGCRYLTADVGHLIHAARGAPEDWKGPFPSMREAWGGFWSSFGPGWRYYHQSMEDPLPGLAEPLTFQVWGRWRRSP